jgi:AraC family transcriptional regulator of adaptative response / DNA-3-methyladenine glycosylase II
MPRARASAIVALARRMVDEPNLLTRGATLDQSIEKLRELPGFGAWTAHYVALRALREADAFPASDVGLLRAMSDENGVRPSVEALSLRAERWRPWRAYAAQLLWTSAGALARGRPSCE